MRFDSLLFGVLLSYFHHHYPKHTSELVRVWRWPIVAYLLLVVATWVVVPRSHPLMSTIGLSALTLAFGGLTLLAVTSDIRPWVPLASLYRGCCRLGEYSYSIYLWHYPIQYVTGPAVRRILCTESAPPGLCYALYACGSVVVGIIMARLVEIPVLHLRDHWFPSRSGSLR
jgi:peptidoglycan/LPS O-acetylase OafA/YrhL